MRRIGTMAVAVLCGVAAVPVDAEELRIGLLTTLSGPGSGLGVDIRDGFKLALEEEGGKLGGAKGNIQFQSFDRLIQVGIEARYNMEFDERLAQAKALIERFIEAKTSGVDADLRELVLGSPNQGGTWTAPPDRELLLERAEAAGLSRALYCAMTLLAEFFPDVESQARALTPDVGLAMRALLGKMIVEPSRDLGRETVNRAAEQIRKLLTAGAASEPE
ncbi:MAG: DUF3164 family protein [Myxococcales bacterium]